MVFSEEMLLVANSGTLLLPVTKEFDSFEEELERSYFSYVLFQAEQSVG